MHVAVLGLGAMGRRMAAHLAARHRLTVWNRSPEPTGPLAALGAAVAASPRAAAAEADLVLAMLTDDDASRAVWDGPEGALAGLRHGAVAAECSTVSPAYVAEWGERVRAAGARPLDAPVSGSRPQAEAATLVTLVGGEADALAEARPAFETYSKDVRHVGPLGHGALAKLAVNALMGVQVAAAAEPLAATPAASPVAQTALRLMAENRHDPLFPVDLLEKDLRYALDADGDTPVVAATRAVFERAQAEGLGEQNMTAVACLYE